MFRPRVLEDDNEDITTTTIKRSINMTSIKPFNQLLVYKVKSIKSSSPSSSSSSSFIINIEKYERDRIKILSIFRRNLTLLSPKMKVIEDSIKKGHIWYDGTMKLS